MEEPFRAAVATGGDPARLSGKLVSADYFHVFGVKARIGRTFAPGEDQPGATPVVVLSYSFWQTQFGGDPGVLKRDLMLDGRTAQDHRGFTRGQFRPGRSAVLETIDLRAGSTESPPALAARDRAPAPRCEHRAGAGQDEHVESQS